MITALCFCWRTPIGYQLVFMVIPIGYRIRSIEELGGLVSWPA